MQSRRHNLNIVSVYVVKVMKFCVYRSLFSEKLLFHKTVIQIFIVFFWLA